MKPNPLVCLVPVLLAATSILPLDAADRVATGPLLETLRSVGGMAEGHRQATAAWRQLATAEADQLSEILAGMQGAGKLSENWIRAAVETIAERTLKQGKPLPVADLEKFLADTRQSPRGRRLAYELIARVDKTAQQRLIPPLLEDPSLELRRDAVGLALVEADRLAEAGQREQAVAAYRRAFQASRDLDQIKAASGKLRELDQQVNLPGHMGFLLYWKLIGPFDNTEGKGFDMAYPPEQAIDLEARYDGKVGEVGWIDHATGDDFGIVDLNVAFKRPKNGDAYELTSEHKGAVAYAFTEFTCAEERNVDLRLGCINANKIWLNGELLTANQVYHSGMEVDQYVAPARLKAGRNTILLKIAQNEQEEDWAQRWQFQLRVCDQLGTPVLARAR